MLVLLLRVSTYFQLLLRPTSLIIAAGGLFRQIVVSVSHTTPVPMQRRLAASGAATLPGSTGFHQQSTSAVQRWTEAMIATGMVLRSLVASCCLPVSSVRFILAVSTGKTVDTVLFWCCFSTSGSHYLAFWRLKPSSAPSRDTHVRHSFAYLWIVMVGKIWYHEQRQHVSHKTNNWCA